MSLSSVGNPAWETIRGVRFAMLYGSTLVPVLITHAAVDDIEPPAPGVGGHLACFNKHRDTFEQAARATLGDLKLPWVFHRIGSMFCLFFTSGPVTDLASAKRSDLAKFASFFRGCLDRGVYFAPSQFESGFLSMAHQDSDLDATNRVMRESLAAL